jgi:hypothetical protein
MTQGRGILHMQMLTQTHPTIPKRFQLIALSTYYRPPFYNFPNMLPVATYAP